MRISTHTISAIGILVNGQIDQTVVSPLYFLAQMINPNRGNDGNAPTLREYLSKNPPLKIPIAKPIYLPRTVAAPRRWGLLDIHPPLNTLYV